MDKKYSNFKRIFFSHEKGGYASILYMNFPGGSVVVKSSNSQCREPGFNSWSKEFLVNSWTKTPYAVLQGQEKKKKKKQ